MLSVATHDQRTTHEDDTMAAVIIDIAEYRRRKAEAAQRAASPPMAPTPVMVPMFCGYGWVLVPMMMPVPASGGWHA